MSTDTEIDGAQILAQALEDLANPRHRVQLMYVEHDDQLTAEQIQHCLDGNVEKVDEHLDEWAFENRHWGLQAEIKDLIPDEDERDALTTEQQERLEQAILDKDESQPFRDLLRNTGNVLMRYDLGQGTGDWDLPPDSWSWSEERVNEWAHRLLKMLRLGLDPKARVNVTRDGSYSNLDAARELVLNASYGGRLYVIWYGDVEDVVQAAVDDTVGNREPRIITFRDPHILVLDNMNGSGHDVSMSGSISRIWDLSRCVVDSAGGGYGWDSIAGLHKPYYAGEVTVTPIRKPEVTP